ncbi:MAG: GxxExxY protein [Phycisphaeraceae bacterium]|nr:GxxExxY protein [Phycisphaeraceae bacterium]
MSNLVIGAAIEVHRALGPGMLESVYKRCLRKELEIRGLAYECQVAVPVVYKGEVTQDALRLDLLVERALIVEVKAMERLLPVHGAQLLSYLRLTNARMGLLLNFHVPVLKDGLRRIMLNF